MATGDGMANEDAVRASISALDEVADFTRRALIGLAEDESWPREPEYQGPEYEGIYVREQLGRIAGLAEWMRDHLENLTDPTFVARGAKRMAAHDQERREGGA
jgi:hypothetical protein